MKLLIFIIFSYLSAIGIVSAQAGAGACSWHDGVNCSAGWQPDGTVVCNDGWRDSMVQYDFVQMCQTDYDRMQAAMRAQTYISPDRSIPDYTSLQSECMKEMYQSARYIDRVKYCSEYVTNTVDHAVKFPSCPQNSSRVANGPSTTEFFCECNDGYYNYKNSSGYGTQGYCSPGEKPVDTMQALREWSESIPNIMAREVSSDNHGVQSEPVASPKTNSELCQEDFGQYSLWDGTYNNGDLMCGCRQGYAFDESDTCVLVDQICLDAYGLYSEATKVENNRVQKCECKLGYTMSQDKECVKEKTKEITDSGSLRNVDNHNDETPSQNYDALWYFVGLFLAGVFVFNSIRVLRNREV